MECSITGRGVRQILDNLRISQCDFARVLRLSEGAVELLLMKAVLDVEDQMAISFFAERHGISSEQLVEWSGKSRVTTSNKGMIIVSGGTRGIGKAISLWFLKTGYGVIALYKKRHEAARQMEDFVSTKLFRQLTNRSVFLAFPSDVSNREDVARVFRHNVVENVVGVVNNAGVYPRGDAPSGLELEQVFSTNVLGPYYLIQEYALYLREHPISGFGSVVNIGSTSAFHGPTGSAIYAASKAALQRLGSILAVEHARNMRINTIVCGPVETDLLKQAQKSSAKYRHETPSGKLTTPEEIAEVVGWLIDNNRTNNIVGSTITVDGGRIS